MLSGLFRTCQAPGLAAEVDLIAHFGHFRSLGWRLVAIFLAKVAKGLAKVLAKFNKLSKLSKFDS